ncbi:DUF2306 domain-containing protein [Microbacterium karelineae]|uniref:DUF2306 domain-containing protein n=1 Tax=Microbacterium karelineae TaxID=2654283 RepID=UPI0012E99918|nr:DUF2306 domain-containing protein [Microbacterium karelineae]
MSSAQPRVPAREWALAAGLILLALVPVAAGSARLGSIAGGVSTPETARFVDDPVPIVLHIVAALVFSLVGAFQFLPTMRRRRTRWHMFAGRFLLVPAGVVVAGSGLWMNAVYTMPPVDGLGLAISRWIVGILTLAFLALGVANIARRRLPEHGAWMIRAYALAMGAGTQVLTSMPFILAFGPPDELARLLQMDAGWILNLFVAEVVIRRRIPSRRTTAVGV